MKGAAWAAALIRSSEDALGSLMMPNKKSSGDIAGFAAAASIAAFMSAVFLFGVPRRRPPRLSPGFDPRGIAVFSRPVETAGASGVAAAVQAVVPPESPRQYPAPEGSAATRGQRRLG